VERTVLVILDISGSMQGERNRKALELLADSARQWAGEPATFVIAVPFSSSFSILAAGPEAARQRVEALPTFTGHVTYAPNARSLADGLAQVPCNGGTRLYDTILDVLPLVEAFPEADLTLEVISDGGDNASRHSEAETFAAIEALLKKKSSDNRFADVYLRRYERVNEALRIKFKDIADQSGGRVRVFVTELEEPVAPPPCLEVSPVSVALDRDEQTGELVTPELRAELLHVTQEAPLLVEVLEANGLSEPRASLERLAPGMNSLALSFTVADGASATFWSDCPLVAHVRIGAAGAGADIWASATLPAGWRVFKRPVVLGALAVAVAALAGGVLLLRRRVRSTHIVSSREDPVAIGL